jgi:DNA repair protein RadD
MLVFCSTILSSQRTAAFFCDAGLAAAHLDGNTPRDERRQILRDLETGTIRIVANCALISEGLNIPTVDAVMQLRPTKSLTVYLQAIGRALRPAPGKEYAVILDIAGNCFRHGSPDLEHPWTLEGRKKQNGEAPLKRCPECGSIVPANVRVCPWCGHQFPPPTVKPIKSSKLIETPPAVVDQIWLATTNFASATAWAGQNENRLHAVALARGYAPGWVWHRLNGGRA